MDKYKDLPEIIADMLIKQDQTIDAVNRLSEKVEAVLGRIDITNQRIETTNNILKNFVEISIKHLAEQTRFNELSFMP